MRLDSTGTDHPASPAGITSAPAGAPCVVLDSNIWVDLLVFRDPHVEPIRHALEAGTIAPVIRADCREELRRVLAYAQFAIPPARQGELLDAYRARLTLVAPPTADAALLPPCRDPDDQKFLEIARDAQASVLLTRDKLLLRLRRHRLIRPLFDICPPDGFSLPAD